MSIFKRNKNEVVSESQPTQEEIEKFVYEAYLNVALDYIERSIETPTLLGYLDYIDNTRRSRNSIGDHFRGTLMNISAINDPGYRDRAYRVLNDPRIKEAYKRRMLMRQTLETIDSRQIDELVSSMEG